MRLPKGCTTRTSVLAVQGALVSLALAGPARAEDPTVAELTHPTSQVEAGAGYVSDSSFKFGEYNGLHEKGAFAIGNFALHGGGAWDSNDATRWNLHGSNLGLQTRELSADYGVQGRFRLNLRYDELLHNLSDTYKTPYSGANGFTLPGNWLKPVVPQVSPTAINFRALDPRTGDAPSLTGPPTPAQLATTAAIRAADLPAFHNVDLKTKRTTADGGFLYEFDRHWQFTASARTEQRKGAKAIGAITTKSTFESVVTLPDPVDDKTNLFNAALNYTADKMFMQAAYYGAIYRNDIKTVSWQDPSNLALFSTMGSAPSNDFHQFSLTGGYNFSRSTKLVVNGFYGRNTQNDAFFFNDPQLPLGVPQSSLNGLVITEGFNAKLSLRPTNRLNVYTGYKWDVRDNRTPVNRYVFYDVNQPPTGSSSFNAALGLPPGTLGSNININNNRPFSRRVNQFNLDGDYALTKRQTLAAGYTFEKYDRWCNGTWAKCVDADTTKEHTLRGEWRARLGEEISTKLGYAYSSRKALDYNSNAWLAFVPMANVVPGAPTVGATTSVYGFLQQTGLTGWGPVAGFPTTPLTGQAAIFTPNNNIVPQALYGSRDQVAENPGMRRFQVADRHRHKVRSSLTWEPNERLALYSGVDMNYDDYYNSPLGLQLARSWQLNLDAGYRLSQGLTVNLFFSHEDQRSQQAGWNYVANAAAGTPSPIIGGCFPDTAQKNLNNKIDPCNSWQARSKDLADTLGVALRHSQLMGGRLDLLGSIVFSRARTDIDVWGGNYATIPGTTSLIYIRAEDLPTVKYDTLEFRLSGQYALTKNAAVRGLYSFKRLKSADFMYEGMQPGTMVGDMPSYEQAPNYKVHVVGVSYVYSFR